MGLPPVPGTAPPSETLSKEQPAFRAENRRPALRLEKIFVGLNGIALGWCCVPSMKSSSELIALEGREPQPD